MKVVVPSTPTPAVRAGERDLELYEDGVVVWMKVVGRGRTDRPVSVVAVDLVDSAGG